MSFSDIAAAISSEFTDFWSAAVAAKVAFRLCLAGLLGGLLGYERESRGKAAGLRTHMLVCIGASLVVIGALLSDADVRALARVIQGLVAGIGFLGAGAILKEENQREVHGLTTAATIWFTAAIGITVGSGHASTAILAAVIALVVLQVIGRWETLVRLDRNGEDGKEVSDEGGSKP